jgi:hypothetical protein
VTYTSPLKTSNLLKVASRSHRGRIATRFGPGPGTL